MAGRFETLWYEDKEGNYLGAGSFESMPEGAKVQVTRFPFELHTTYLISGEGEEGPTTLTATSGYSPDLLLAMIRPTVKERVKQFLRYGSLAEVQEPKMAVFLAAATCERCANSLAHRYGLDWGYPEDSDEWHLCGTECHRCEHLGQGKFWVRTESDDPEFPHGWSLNWQGRAAAAKRWREYCTKQGLTVEEMEAQLASQQALSADEEE